MFYYHDAPFIRKLKYAIYTKDGTERAFESQKAK
jgi:hypothetical protein